MLRPTQPHLFCRVKQLTVGISLSLSMSLSMSLAASLTAVGLVTLPTQPAAADEISDAIDDLYYYSDERWIEVDTSTQTLLAWEGDELAYEGAVSTGLEPDYTPTGVFAIDLKFETAEMQNAETADLDEQYDIDDVPYVMYYDGHYAIHGAYWHDAFGTPVSHGCVNMPVADAAWLYDWAPLGTPVVVR